MRFLILALAVAATLPTAGAECFPGRVATATLGDYYVDTNACLPGCLLDFVVYQESNGLGQLQRRDFYADDTCGGEIESDRPLVLMTL